MKPQKMAHKALLVQSSVIMERGLWNFFYLLLLLLCTHPTTISGAARFTVHFNGNYWGRFYLTNSTAVYDVLASDIRRFAPTILNLRFLSVGKGRTIIEFDVNETFGNGCSVYGQVPQMWNTTQAAYSAFSHTSESITNSYCDAFFSWSNYATSSTYLSLTEDRWFLIPNSTQLQDAIVYDLIMGIGMPNITLTNFSLWPLRFRANVHVYWFENSWLDTVEWNATTAIYLNATGQQRSNITTLRITSAAMVDKTWNNVAISLDGFQWLSVFDANRENEFRPSFRGDVLRYLSPVVDDVNVSIAASTPFTVTLSLLTTFVNVALVKTVTTLPLLTSLYNTANNITTGGAPVSVVFIWVGSAPATVFNATLQLSGIFWSVIYALNATSVANAARADISHALDIISFTRFSFSSNGEVVFALKTCDKATVARRMPSINWTRLGLSYAAANGNLETSITTLSTTYDSSIIEFALVGGTLWNTVDVNGQDFLAALGADFRIFSKSSEILQISVTCALATGMLVSVSAVGTTDLSVANNFTAIGSYYRNITGNTLTNFSLVNRYSFTCNMVWTSSTLTLSGSQWATFNATQLMLLEDSLQADLKKRIAFSRSSQARMIATTPCMFLFSIYSSLSSVTQLIGFSPTSTQALYRQLSSTTESLMISSVGGGNYTVPSCVVLRFNGTQWRMVFDRTNGVAAITNAIREDLGVLNTIVADVFSYPLTVSLRAPNYAAPQRWSKLSSLYSSAIGGNAVTIATIASGSTATTTDNGCASEWTSTTIIFAGSKFLSIFHSDSPTLSKVINAARVDLTSLSDGLLSDLKLAEAKLLIGGLSLRLSIRQPMNYGVLSTAVDGLLRSVEFTNLRAAYLAAAGEALQSVLLPSSVPAALSLPFTVRFSGSDWSILLSSSYDTVFNLVTSELTKMTCGAVTLQALSLGSLIATGTASVIPLSTNSTIIANVFISTLMAASCDNITAYYQSAVGTNESVTLLEVTVASGFFTPVPTTNPTQSPATGSPTQSPATGSPTQSPATGSPTQSPATGSPTQSPATGSPVQLCFVVTFSGGHWKTVLANVTKSAVGAAIHDDLGFDVYVAEIYSYPMTAVLMYNGTLSAPSSWPKLSALYAAFIAPSVVHHTSFVQSTSCSPNWIPMSVTFSGNKWRLVTLTSVSAVSTAALQDLQQSTNALSADLVFTDALPVVGGLRVRFSVRQAMSSTSLEPFVQQLNFSSLSALYFAQTNETVGAMLLPSALPTPVSFPLTIRFGGSSWSGVLSNNYTATVTAVTTLLQAVMYIDAVTVTSLVVGSLVVNATVTVSSLNADATQVATIVSSTLLTSNCDSLASFYRAASGSNESIEVLAASSFSSPAPSSGSPIVIIGAAAGGGLLALVVVGGVIYFVCGKLTASARSIEEADDIAEVTSVEMDDDALAKLFARVVTGDKKAIEESVSDEGANAVRTAHSVVQSIQSMESNSTHPLLFVAEGLRFIKCISGPPISTAIGILAVICRIAAEVSAAQLASVRLAQRLATVHPLLIAIRRQYRNESNEGLYQTMEALLKRCKEFLETFLSPEGEEGIGAWFQRMFKQVQTNIADFDNLHDEITHTLQAIQLETQVRVIDELSVRPTRDEVEAMFTAEGKRLAEEQNRLLNDVNRRLKIMEKQMFKDDVQAMRIGGVKIEAPLQKGGQGTVCLALYEDNECVAKSLIAQTEGEATALIREAQVLMSLRHCRNIVRCYGLFKDSSVWYLVMEKCEVDLRTIVSETGAVPSTVAALIGLQIARALKALHDAKLVHRDVKPENVMLKGDVQNTFCLIDFGSTKRAAGDANLTTAVANRGRDGTTERYAAPEIVLGDDRFQATEKCDSYSFGLMLYELCSGQLPFQSELKKQTIFNIHLEELRPTLNPEWPKQLTSLMQRCWAVPPTHRPALGDVVTELIEYLDVALPLPQMRIAELDSFIRSFRSRSLAENNLFK